MTEHEGGLPPMDPPEGGGSPPPPPVPAEGYPPEISVSDSAPGIPGPLPEPRRRPVAYLAVVIGLLAMVGAAVFAARSLGSNGNKGGAPTPIAAVQKMFDAMSNQDAIGALESLLPSERAVFTKRFQDATHELGRLGVLKENLDLGNIPGVDLSFQGLKFSATSIASGVTTVTVDAGTSRFRVDPNTALGTFVRDLLPPDLKRVQQGSDDLAGQDVNFTTIREGNKWYLSVWYSVAEDARTTAGLEVPNFGNGLKAKGAATPEKAVEELLRAGARLDVRRVIELLPPDEAAALHDYAPLFIDDVESGLAEARKHFNLTFRTLTLKSSGGGDESLVTIDKISFALSIPEAGISVDFDGTCLKVSGGFFGGSQAPKRICGKGLSPATGLPNLPTPKLGFVTVKRDGQWYVSPTRTVLDGFISILKALNRSDLERFKGFFGQFSQEFSQTAQLTIPSA